MSYTFRKLPVNVSYREIFSTDKLLVFIRLLLTTDTDRGDDITPLFVMVVIPPTVLRLIPVPAARFDERFAVIADALIEPVTLILLVTLMLDAFTLLVFKVGVLIEVENVATGHVIAVMTLKLDTFTLLFIGWIVKLTPLAAPVADALP